MMGKLRYTYLAKGKYWRFRHVSVGDFPIHGKPGSPAFMANYGALLAKIGGEVVAKREQPPKAALIENAKEAWIYFIQSADGPVKIGFTSDIKKRMSNLRTSHPGDLKLIAQFPGTRHLERVIHAELWQHRLNGEWFADVPAVTKVIDTLKEVLES